MRKRVKPSCTWKNCRSPAHVVGKRTGSFDPSACSLPVLRFPKGKNRNPAPGPARAPRNTGIESPPICKGSSDPRIHGAAIGPESRWTCGFSGCPPSWIEALRLIRGDDIANLRKAVYWTIDPRPGSACWRTWEKGCRVAPVPGSPGCR